MSKPKFAMYWAASCGGCEIAVLNIHEKILDVDAAFDVVFWPVAMDAKYAMSKRWKMARSPCACSMAACATTRTNTSPDFCAKKSKIMVSFGSCACEGCIPGLANFSSITDMVDTRFLDHHHRQPG